MKVRVTLIAVVVQWTKLMNPLDETGQKVYKKIVSSMGNLREEFQSHPANWSQVAFHKTLMKTRE
jgi:hypothetical protein